MCDVRTIIVPLPEKARHIISDAIREEISIQEVNNHVNGNNLLQKYVVYSNQKDVQIFYEAITHVYFLSDDFRLVFKGLLKENGEPVLVACFTDQQILAILQNYLNIMRMQHL